MLKKLTLSCMAVVAFAAFILPATASANNKPRLTDATGAVAVGSTIIGTNIGETTFVTTNQEPLVHCNKATLTGKVLRNDNGFVEGTIEKAVFQGTGATSTHNNLPECTGTFGNAYITVELPLCIRSTPANPTDTFEVGTEKNNKCSEGVGKAEFIIGSTTAGACTYTTTNAVTGSFTTGGTETTLEVHNTQAGSGATLTSGGFLCPHSGQLKMSFTLETSNGKDIFFDLLP